MESNTVIRGRRVVIWREDAYGIEYGFTRSRGCNLEGRHVQNRTRLSGIEWFRAAEKAWEELNMVTEGPQKVNEIS